MSMQLTSGVGDLPKITLTAEDDDRVGGGYIERVQSSNPIEFTSCLSRKRRGGVRKWQWCKWG